MFVPDTKAIFVVSACLLKTVFRRGLSLQMEQLRGGRGSSQAWFWGLSHHYPFTALGDNRSQHTPNCRGAADNDFEIGACDGHFSRSAWLICIFQLLNTLLGIAVKLFVEVVSVHTQLAFQRGNHPRQSGWCGLNRMREGGRGNGAQCILND